MNLRVATLLACAAMSGCSGGGGYGIRRPLDGGADGGAATPDFAGTNADLSAMAPVDLSSPPPDFAMTISDLAVIRACPPKPGNPGNENGVGKYCTMNSDCANQPATTCLGPLAGSQKYNFCTQMCQVVMPDPCGSGAQCSCVIPGLCFCLPYGCGLDMGP